MKSTEHCNMSAVDASSLLPDAGGNSGGVENKSEDWTRFGKRQILSVGKKKEALRYNDDDDELADGYHSSSDEEDGRTAAGKEKKKKKISIKTVKQNGMVNAAETMGHSPKAKSTEKKLKTKKKKKKSNSTQADNTSVTEQDAMGSIESAQSNFTQLDACVDNDIKDGATTVNEVPQNDETMNKKKRKKIRSRQKNIRKDHRAENAKPSHLIVGTNEYCGRPMTKETRQKLGIHSTAKKIIKSRSTIDAYESGEWVGFNKSNDIMDEINEESIPEMVEWRGTSTLTKIGDCLVNNDAKIDVGHDVLTGLNDSATIKSTTTKKQKRKFKNLLVG